MTDMPDTRTAAQPHDRDRIREAFVQIVESEVVPDQVSDVVGLLDVAMAATPATGTEGLEEADLLADAVLTWRSGAVVEALAHKYRAVRAALGTPR